MNFACLSEEFHLGSKAILQAILSIFPVSKLHFLFQLADRYFMFNFFTL